MEDRVLMAKIRHKNIVIAIVSAVLILIIAALALFFGNNEEYDPEQIVRTSVFDEYNDYPELRGANFGGLIWSFVKNSSVHFRDKAEEDRFVLSHEFNVNVESALPEAVKGLYQHDPLKEDLVCVSLSEHIDFVKYEGDSIYYCVFTVDKTTESAVPALYFTTLDGEMNGEPVTGADAAIDSFYGILINSKKVIDYLKSYK